MIEAVLWDNDGVLVDTEELFFSATREALAQAQVELSRDHFIEFAMGNGRSVFDLIKGWTPDQINALRRQRDLAYAAMLSAGCSVMDGVAETLQELKGKARMAVVTSAPREHFDLAHRRSGLQQFFDLVVAREDYVQSKPHPEPYLTALKRLEVSAGRCLAVEDSERGLKSTLAAGVRCIVVPNRLTRGSTFAGAAAIVDDVRVIPAMLKTL